MKAIKYLLIGALMIGINTPSTAQEEDHKAVIEQLTKVIKSDAPDKEDQVKDLFKEYKKEPDVIVAVGRAYLDIKDTENAQKYADMAIKRDKNYGDAYVLAGDIQVINDNGGAASALFEQAIYFDPKNPNGYRRYAQVNSKANPSAAVAKLEEMKKQIPDYPIALISAEIFSNRSICSCCLKNLVIVSYKTFSVRLVNCIVHSNTKVIEVSCHHRGNHKSCS